MGIKKRLVFRGMDKQMSMGRALGIGALAGGIRHSFQLFGSCDLGI